jgi:hypothetical protein
MQNYRRDGDPRVKDGIEGETLTRRQGELGIRYSITIHIGDN